MLKKKSRFSHGFSLFVLVSGLLSVIGAYALSSGHFPAEVLNTVSWSLSITAQAESVEQQKPAEKNRAGGSNDRIIFGVGNMGWGNPNRRNRILTIDPLNPAGGTGSLSAINDYDPAFSPDGKLIAFISSRDRATNSDENRRYGQELYIMNSDGSSQRRIGGPDPSGGEAHPAFSPDGQKILYAAENDWFLPNYYQGLFEYDLNTGTHTQIFDANNNDCAGSLTARKKNNKERSKLIPGIFWIANPNYSHDGEHIVFVMWNTVYRINSEGGECTVLHTADWPYWITEAAYSPQGDKIAIDYLYMTGMFAPKGSENANNLGTQNNIRIIHPETGNVLGEYPAHNLSGSPVWSPDETKIAFFSGAMYSHGGTRDFDISVLDLATSEVEKIYESGLEMEYTLSGMDWGVPSSVLPPISIRIDSPPMPSGSSTIGTVHLADPLRPVVR